MDSHPRQWLVHMDYRSRRHGDVNPAHRSASLPGQRRRWSAARQAALLAVLLSLVGGAGRADPAAPDWRVMGAMPPGVEGAMQLVVVPESRRRERRYFQAVGQALCRDQRQCAVLFWTDARQVPRPEDLAISNTSRAAIVAQYSVIPGVAAPLLQLPCAFYSNPSLGRAMSCLDYAATEN